MVMYKIVESRCLLYKKGQTTSYQEFGTSDILGTACGITLEVLVLIKDSIN